VDDISLIDQNYRHVLERISQASNRAGRDPAGVKLVVVTKTHPLEVVQAVVEAGATYLGENYAEEAIPKILSLSSDRKIEWHMIGHVQSRKAMLICDYFDYMHSLDSVKLAARLQRFADDKNRVLPVLLECNLAGEANKYGWPIWLEDGWNHQVSEIRQVLDYPHLDVRGLMGMAPFFSEPGPARPYYDRLRRFGDFLKQKIPQADWSELSMGMSGDFEVAIEEGATWIRVGTSILGPRG